MLLIGGLGEFFLKLLNSIVYVKSSSPEQLFVSNRDCIVSEFSGKVIWIEGCSIDKKGIVKFSLFVNKIAVSFCRR